jgi:hypothetical protein
MSSWHKQLTPLRPSADVDALGATLSEATDLCKTKCLQVNHSPSFNIDTPLDRAVKGALVADSLRLARASPTAMRRAQQVCGASLGPTPLHARCVLAQLSDRLLAHAWIRDQVDCIAHCCSMLAE